MDDGYIQQIDDAETLLFEPANDFVNEFFEDDRYQLGLDVISLQRLHEKNIALSSQDSSTSFQMDNTVRHVINWYAQHSKDADTPITIEGENEHIYTNLNRIISAYNHMVGATYKYEHR